MKLNIKKIKVICLLELTAPFELDFFLPSSQMHAVKKFVSTSPFSLASLAPGKKTLDPIGLSDPIGSYRVFWNSTEAENSAASIKSDRIFCDPHPIIQ